MILVVVHSLSLICFKVEQFSFFKQSLLPECLFLQVIAYQCCVILDETVLFSATTSVKFTPLLTNEVIFELIFIHIVV